MVSARALGARGELANSLAASGLRRWPLSKC